ncbi:L-histidine N(alpha)-methyltransferase [Anditalea andensis]|uniref:Methyltransferase n=1 Tax=Anditalea andensis TaxID=1048983 RepID=A0A074KY12_9BACT|nr:L-histidine N(alpha)-methyltransferase [Anditalea andensis]KEO73839.1 methyltransferase [Anditalea andensis]
MNQSNTTTAFDKVFAQDILNGLTSPVKYLPSKYFYDEKGDKLFQQIMALPEYYLTRTEFLILEKYAGQILQPFINKGEKFNLIELGAGNGYKTRILIKYLYDRQVPFNYYPIDISGNVLDELKEAFLLEFPNLTIYPIKGTYRATLTDCNWEKNLPNLMLFLGSNFGNFVESDALDLMDYITHALNPQDGILIGFDLKKDPQLILDAYNDSKGVTRDFNLNLLHRINKELDADFDVAQFKHWPVYNPDSGECKSYLVSLKDQTVNIGALNKKFQIVRAEPIFTEVSRKFSLQDIQQLGIEKGFKILEDFMDDEGFFSDSMLIKN